MRRGSAVTARWEPTEPARHARAGREVCYLHPAHPESVGSGCARAHTHIHTPACLYRNPSRDPAPSLNITRVENRCVPRVSLPPLSRDSHSIPPAPEGWGGGWEGDVHQVGEESWTSLHCVHETRFCDGAEKRKEEG